MMVTKRIVIISSLLSFCAFTYEVGAENIAIHAGNILTISGNVIEHGIILIKDGKVEALGRDVIFGKGGHHWSK